MKSNAIINVALAMHCPTVVPIDFIEIDDLFLRVGTTVKKRSNKPFKSGRKTVTIKGFTINPHSGKQACLFEEDDSIVDIIMLEEYETNRSNIGEVPADS